MFLSLGIPIGTLLFLSVILFMYLSKKKYHDFQNQLFIFLLLFTFGMVFLELFYLTTMHYMDKIPLINEIACRAFLICFIVWITTFFFYVVSMDPKNTFLRSGENYDKKLIRLIIAICTALGIVDCFLKIDYLIDNGLYAIVGMATWFVYAVVGIWLLFVSIIVIKNKETSFEPLRITIYMALVAVISDIILFIFYPLNNLTLILSLVVAALYFTNESQDRMLLKEVGEAKAKSEEVNKAKTDFLANMSHEIRTPMNTILGFSNALLADDNLTKEKVIKESININEASNDLLELINNILELSRIESNKEEVILKEFSLIDLLKEINVILKTKTTPNNNWFDISVNESIPSKYSGDYGKINKIIEGVLYNAIKYTHYGYINALVDYSKGILSIEFSNSGTKMPIDYYNKDFSDFSKLDYSNDNKLDNELLGLIIAKRLVSMINGTIEFSIKDGVTISTINIKLNSVGDTPIGSVTFDNTDVTDLDCTGKRVLIVDDNKLNLKLAEKLFNDYHFDVFTAISGSECIDMIKQENYDLILLDHMMPDMDGIKTLEVIKSLSKKTPPIIAMTANATTDSKDFYIKMGFDGYISKPMKKSKIDEMIYNVFGGKK